MYIIVINDSTCIITSAQKSLDNKVQFYPNPVEGQLNISNAKSIVIYSVDGKFILKSTSEQVNVSALQPGIYHLLITNKLGETTTEKLIKK